MKKKKIQIYEEIGKPPQPEPPRLSEPPLEQSEQGVPASLTQKEVIQTKHEGQKDALKETAQIEEKNQRKLEKFTKQPSRILFSCKSVFPFDFFPDEVSIEDTRVNFIIKEFFLSAALRTVSIKDIYEVIVNTSAFFASLKVTSRYMLEGEVEIQFLRKEDALYARRLIEGLRTLDQQGVDTNLLEIQPLMDKIEEIGKIQTSE